MSTLGAENESGRELILSQWRRLYDKVSADDLFHDKLQGFVVERLLADETKNIPRPLHAEHLPNPFSGWNLRGAITNRPDVQSSAYWIVDQCLSCFATLPIMLATKILVIVEEYETTQRQAGSSPA